jgi:hypothetical protein
VDVPYAFDGGMTGTVRIGTQLSLNFVLVRAQAKLEAPLVVLQGLYAIDPTNGNVVRIGGGGGAVIISTIAEVTFYGHDQAGNQVSVTGTISVNFADWADPSS